MLFQAFQCFFNAAAALAAATLRLRCCRSCAAPVFVCWAGLRSAPPLSLRNKTFGFVTVMNDELSRDEVTPNLASVSWGCEFRVRAAPKSTPPPDAHKGRTKKSSEAHKVKHARIPPKQLLTTQLPRATHAHKEINFELGPQSRVLPICECTNAMQKFDELAAFKRTVS